MGSGSHRHGPHGLGQQLHEVPPEVSGAKAWAPGNPTTQEAGREQPPDLPGSDLSGGSGHSAPTSLQRGSELQGSAEMRRRVPHLV